MTQYGRSLTDRKKLRTDPYGSVQRRIEERSIPDGIGMSMALPCGEAVRFNLAVVSERDAARIRIRIRIRI